MNPGKSEAHELMMMIIVVEVMKFSPGQLIGGRVGRVGQMFADSFRDFFVSFWETTINGKRQDPAANLAISRRVEDNRGWKAVNGGGLLIVEEGCLLIVEGY
jgi:hypothetical protein